MYKKLRKKMKKILLAIVALTFISLNASETLTPTSKDAKPLSGKNMMIIISSGEIEKSGMGMTLGLSAANVTIVIGANALKFAQIKGDQHKFLAKQLTHREILQKAVKNGANIQICYMCAKALGLTDKDFIKGSKVVKSLKIFNKMYEEGTKVLSF